MLVDGLGSKFKRMKKRPVRVRIFIKENSGDSRDSKDSWEIWETWEIWEIMIVKIAAAGVRYLRRSERT
jgi:hypothetical protein